ncbi:MAG: hypothetical protein Fur0019_07340 [Tibeticola sp.]
MLTRRTVSAAQLDSLLHPPSRSSSEDALRWIGSTEQLETTHPRIRLLALSLTQLLRTPQEKAVACFDHVRSLPFGCVGDGIHVRATEVLKRGRGDCHTKSTLLVALLRSIEIPARVRFLALQGEFLRGLLDLDSLPVLHCAVEVLLDGRWILVDTHVVDPEFACAARARLRSEGHTLGWGIHLGAQTDWDGRSPAFGQIVPDDHDSWPLRDWGVFDDPAHFYTTVPEVRRRLGWRGRMRWKLASRLVNRRVNALRESADGCAPPPANRRLAASARLHAAPNPAR